MPLLKRKNYNSQFYVDFTYKITKYFYRMRVIMSKKKWKVSTKMYLQLKKKIFKL